MTPQKAIEWLEAIEEKYIHGGDDYFDEKRKIAINIAISALEKQIPKKPVAHGKYRFICPVCKQELGIEREDISIYDMTPPKHCDCCGQALDWSDTE